MSNQFISSLHTGAKRTRANDSETEDREELGAADAVDDSAISERASRVCPHAGERALLNIISAIAGAKEAQSKAYATHARMRNPYAIVASARSSSGVVVIVIRCAWHPPTKPANLPPTASTKSRGQYTIPSNHQHQTQTAHFAALSPPVSGL